MKYIGEFGTWIVGIIGSLSAFFSGHTEQAVKILLAMMLIDIVSGVMKGLKNKRLKSAIMHMGILKKGGIILSIIFADLLDVLVNDGMPVFRTLMVWLAIGNEGLSIIENLSALGVTIPNVVKDRLAQVVEENRGLQQEKDKDEAEG